MKITKELKRHLGHMVLAHIQSVHGSQAEAARRWGVTPTFVTNVTSGRRAPSDRMMEEAGIELFAVFTRFVPTPKMPAPKKTPNVRAKAPGAAQEKP